MNKKMLEIAGIIFALVFIIAMSVIFGNVLGFAKSADNSLTAMQEGLVSADLESYNDTTVSGDTVISTINKLHETRNGLKMSYAVCNGSASSSSSWKYYGYQAIKFSSSAGSTNNYVDTVTGSSDYTSYKTSLKPGETGYISPVQEYNAKIVLNDNDVIAGIIFIKR